MNDITRKTYDAACAAIESVLAIVKDQQGTPSADLSLGREYFDAIADLYIADNFGPGDMERVCGLSMDLRKACFAELLSIAFVEGLTVGTLATAGMNGLLKRRRR